MGGSSAPRMENELPLILFRVMLRGERVHNHWCGGITAKEDAMSPLAEIIYDILRGRTSLDDPRITYAELAEKVRDAGEEFEYVHHRNRQLYIALTEIGTEC